MAGKRADLTAYYDLQNISGRIARLMSSKGHSLYDLAKKAGISPSTLTGSFPKNTWSSKNLIKIANLYRVSLDWLQSGKQAASNVTDLANTVDRQVKIFERIAAGSGAEIFDNPLEIIPIANSLIGNIKGEICGFYVKGDSMRPRITEGDLVITKLLNMPAEKPRDRDLIVTVFHNQTNYSEGNLKMFSWVDKNKGIFNLNSFNTYYIPKTFSLKDVRYFFRVHLVISKVDYK